MRYVGSDYNNSVLGAVDEDRPPESLQYRVLGSWWGNVSLVSDPNTALQFFTQDLIAQNLVAFRHQSTHDIVTCSCIL